MKSSLKTNNKNYIKCLNEMNKAGNRSSFHLFGSRKTKANISMIETKISHRRE